ncbi:uncharacterized protein LOC123511358 [Portunus trituberculatus]|uniref:Uncharacterized protein n=1 Tax=Portunus trituberculatus TaxID=210409 RepID=A0A5B7HTJ9_PORTR|nr:uncharacterized protein LOC123511358 [Portunus trituberculatus]MPC72577.1 hypothetical protein [Portunus trituberculatus]
MTEFKREVRKTGGGPPPTLPDDTAKVIGIIGSEVNDLGCAFDCDTGPSDSDVASPAVSENTAITIVLDELVASSSVPGRTTASVCAPKAHESMPKNLATVSKKRKRRFSETNPATLQVSEQQKLLLEE